MYIPLTSIFMYLLLTIVDFFLHLLSTPHDRYSSDLSTITTIREGDKRSEEGGEEKRSILGREKLIAIN